MPCRFPSPCTTQPCSHAQPSLAAMHIPAPLITTRSDKVHYCYSRSLTRIQPFPPTPNTHVRRRALARNPSIDPPTRTHARVSDTLMPEHPLPFLVGHTAKPNRYVPCTRARLYQHIAWTSSSLSNFRSASTAPVFEFVSPSHSPAALFGFLPPCALFCCSALTLRLETVPWP